MNRELKRSYKAYAAWDYEKEEAFINENSKKGWQLIKGGCFNSVYEKNPEKRYVYKLDYNTETMKKSEDRERYIQMFEELGWEYVNSTYNGWNFFRKEYNENSDASEYEIYTDNTSYNEMLNRWCKIGNGVFILESIVSIVYIIMAIAQKSISIGICAVILGLTAIWIKSGLNKMKEKMGD